eukprot:scaffold23126_cov241-Isochrysis_galbana.AAC.4
MAVRSRSAPMTSRLMAASPSTPGPTLLCLAPSPVSMPCSPPPSSFRASPCSEDNCPRIEPQMRTRSRLSCRMARKSSRLPRRGVGVDRATIVACHARGQCVLKSPSTSNARAACGRCSIEPRQRSAARRWVGRALAASVRRCNGSWMSDHRSSFCRRLAQGRLWINGSSPSARVMKSSFRPTLASASAAAAVEADGSSPADGVHSSAENKCRPINERSRGTVPGRVIKSPCSIRSMSARNCSHNQRTALSRAGSRCGAILDPSPGP